MDGRMMIPKRRRKKEMKDRCALGGTSVVALQRLGHGMVTVWDCLFIFSYWLGTDRWEVGRLVGWGWAATLHFDTPLLAFLCVYV